MPAFALDPVLDADCHTLGRLSLCRVLLLDDSRYPWLVLVPERVGAEEIIDLAEVERGLLVQEIAAASEALKALFDPDKLNIGALGNRVRQLHVHVVARFASDPAWPGPVWGHSPAVSYPAHTAGIMMDRVAAALAPHGLREVGA